MYQKLKRINPFELAAECVKLNMEFAKSGTVIEMSGKNDGPQIDKIEQVWGLKGEPYCAMGQYWVFAKTLATLCNVPFNNDAKSPEYCVKVFAGMRGFIRDNYLLFHPACVYMINSAMKNKTWHNFEVNEDANKLIKGDYIFYDFGKDDDKPQRHVEQVVSNDGHVITTVGWNTRPDKNDPSGETNDPAGGGGCFLKNRHANSHAIVGYVRWQR